MRVKLGIGAEGEVVLPQRDAEALGLAPGDEVRIHVARGSFALVARADQSGQAYFAGSLSALSAPEALNYVFTSLKSGVMLLAFGSEARRKTAAARADELRRKSFYFRDGQVVFASSSDPCDRLGAVLQRHGLVKKEDIRRCGKLVGAARPLGQVLVDEKLLSAGQLFDGMTLQVREMLLAACLETEGEFTFLEGPFEEKNEVRLRERARDLLLEAMRRIDELERIAAESVPSRDAVLEPTGVAAQGLPLMQALLLQMVDGRRTVRQAIDESQLGLYHGMRAVAGLLEQGLLVPLTAAPEAKLDEEEEALAGLRPEPEKAAEEEVFTVTASAPEPAAPQVSGPFETYRRIFKRIYQALAAAHPDAPARLDSYFDRLSEKQRPLFEGVRLGEDGELDVAQVLLNVDAGGVYQGAAARAHALEALESFLAFSLFEVKNCLPKHRAEVLLREVGRMQVGKA